ncbi:MBL fold metallo-hydrolase [Lysobacter sp. Root690]|uniref:MBL fold metallo-hydrolase n=1 Tax=Lysobacter sp. Root690 TaxID=1736588 RepID=UPI0009EB507E|nr:MBL fold metallo-hydrolase [Lysobacter sp. Root690]
MTMLSRLLLWMVLAAASPAWAATVTLPSRWSHGAGDEPPLQVEPVAPGLWVLRQSRASNFEAPFLYLIAGKQRALLLDTGAEPEVDNSLPLREIVDDLLTQWQREQGVSSLSLIVAHTHSHRDHVHGDRQFADRPDTHIVGLRPEQVAKVFGLDRWPDGEASFDLGDRELIVLPLPGHEPAHIAIYDKQTASLFSGDTLYPGLLTVRDLAAYRASAERLTGFARRHRIERVLGAHIEMSTTPGVLYPLGGPYQPHEHALALGAKQIAQWQAAVTDAGDFVHEHVSDDFVLGRVAQPGEFADPPNTHGMLVVGTDAVYLSHLPMFHPPHHYQLIFEANLPAEVLRGYREDAAAHPDTYYTLAPTQRWVLPDTIKPDAHFKADLYRGHFERGGTPIARDIDVSVRNIVHFRRFEAGRSEAGRTPQPSRWIGFGRGSQRFAAHRIEAAPDMDQIVQITAPAGAARIEDQPLIHPTRGSAELRRGDRIGGGRVERVIYTEYGDLAQ